MNFRHHEESGKPKAGKKLRTHRHSGWSFFIAARSGGKKNPTRRVFIAAPDAGFRSPKESVDQNA
jgi:hypothetical protein